MVHSRGLYKSQPSGSRSEGAQHGSAEQPPLRETDVAQNAYSGTITDRRAASFRYGRHRRSSSGPCGDTNLHRNIVLFEMKDHGEHASRRFHFVRQTLDSYHRCKRCALCRATAVLIRLHTRSMRHDRGHIGSIQGLAGDKERLKRHPFFFEKRFHSEATPGSS
jgi:hypothetical protein